MSPDQASEIARRAERRRHWPVRSFRLGEGPGDDLSDSTTAEQRLAMMWPLALEAWSLTGRDIPAYDRASTPVRVFRPGERASGPERD